MDIINFDKALSILGLTRNYTEEDLKRAYRQLITKYHPDKWSSKSEKEKKIAEEKAKEINAAKDYLEKNKGQEANTHAKNNSYYGHAAYKYVTFLAAKASFIQELNNYDKELRELIFKANITILINTLDTLLRLNNLYIITLESVKNISDLNNKIIEYRGKVWKELELFTIEYCKKYNINTNTSKLEKKSIKKLYEELEKIRKHQNQKNSILDRIEEEYTLYAGYTVIKEKIIEIKKQILNQYNEGLYNEEEAKRKFETKVLLEFKEYYRRLEIINYFKSLGYKDEVIVDNIELMELHITKDKETFKMYERSITNYIADKETRKTSRVKVKPFDTKETKNFNTSNKRERKDEFIKPGYKIKKR